MKAILVNKDDDGYRAEVAEVPESDLPDGEVSIAVDYSTLNYKDSLAITGDSPVIRSFPMVPGIDLAGTVEACSNDAFQPGDKVILNGWGVGENHWGGLAQKARLQANWLIKLPDAFTTELAMGIGTAGYTAMLCILDLERMGVTPGEKEVIVTGAAGGVGSVAVAVLAKLGYRVAASTGRTELRDYLTGLGASTIVERAELATPSGRPLDAERWAGGVDSVGGETLASVLRGTCYGGAVTACGLAGGTGLPTSVLPFILRNVSLIGVDSVVCPNPKRQTAWDRLAQDLPIEKLDAMTVVEPMSKVLEIAPQILKGQVRGRVVIDVNA